MIDELIEAWQTNHRIHLMLIKDISDEGLSATLSIRGGRDVARQFAHLHTQRLRWLDAKGGKDLAAGLPRFESREQPSRTALTTAMNASTAAITQYLQEVGAKERTARGQKKGIVVSISYFIAHESHHRGSILLTLKHTGHKVGKKTLYGIWDWHRR